MKESILPVVILIALLAIIVLPNALWAARGNGVSKQGRASWYGEGYRGRIMANGEQFDPDALTCASWDWPLGTRLLVTYGHGDPYTDDCSRVIVTVTDRGPDKRLGRILDLSHEAFKRLTGEPALGVVTVEVWVSEEGK